MQIQNEQPTVWAIVDPQAPPSFRTLTILGTGHNIQAPLGRYLGTFQLPLVGLVFHVFDDPSISTANPFTIVGLATEAPTALVQTEKEHR